MLGFKSFFSHRVRRSTLVFLLVLLLLVSLCISLTACFLFKTKATTGVTTENTVQTTAIPTIIAPSGATTIAPTVPSVATTATTAATKATTQAQATTTVPTTTVPTTTASSGVTENRMGYMLSASTSGPQTIRIDYAEFYTGAEAIEKALEDGSDVVEYDHGVPYIPNDYYIRNNNPLIRTFPLASGCLIKMIPEMSGPDATETVTFEQLRAALIVRSRLMTINVVNGSITWMEEFYTP